MKNNYLNKLMLIFKKVEVINFGVGGYTTPQELIYLIENIKYRPDLVITYDGWNDFAYSSSLSGYIDEQDKMTSPLSYHEIFLRLKKISRLKRYCLYGLCFEPLRFLQSFYTIRLLVRFMLKYKIFLKFAESISTSVRSLQSNTVLSASEAAGLYVDNIKAMQGICSGYGIDCISFFQPVITQKDNLTKKEIGLFDKICFLSSNLSLIDRYYEVASNIIKYEKLIVDLSLIFKSERRDVFNDQCHMNDYGYEKIATAISEKIALMCKERLEKSPHNA